MNRIILIGNGFDLAHGMKTRYTDFISDYWNNIILELKKKIAGNMTSIPQIFDNGDIIIKNLPGPFINSFQITASSFEELKVDLMQINSGIDFKNKFLEILTSKHNEQSWVDIEVEYYGLLKKSFKDKSTMYSIKKLNNDFRSVKILLENYLIKIEKEFNESFKFKPDYQIIKETIGFQIYAPFDHRDLDESSLSEKAQTEFESLQNDLSDIRKGLKKQNDLVSKRQYLISRVSENTNVNDIKKLLVAENAINYFDLSPSEILFLNFNYTSTEEIYRYPSQFEAYD